MATKLTPFQKRNAIFKRASAAQKRVLIAKDVIAQIAAKKYKAKKLTWARIKGAKKAGGEEQVCSILDKKDVSCNCCALGGMSSF